MQIAYDEFDNDENHGEHIDDQNDENHGEHTDSLNTSEVCVVTHKMT
jgi:hypothetical protein